MSCMSRRTKNPTSGEALPEPIMQILARFPGVSDQFSTAELLSVFEEFNSYTNKLYMDPVEFKLMMQSLNVG